jgi:hypothetical protein
MIRTTEGDKGRASQPASNPKAQEPKQKLDQTRESAQAQHSRAGKRGGTGSHGQKGGR